MLPCSKELRVMQTGKVASVMATTPQHSNGQDGWVFTPVIILRSKQLRRNRVAVGKQVMGGPGENRS